MEFGVNNIKGIIMLSPQIAFEGAVYVQRIYAMNTNDEGKNQYKYLL